MIIRDASGKQMMVETNAQLMAGLRCGAVRIDSLEQMTATIVAPPDSSALSPEDWLGILKFVSGCGWTLERLGFKVTW